MDRTGYLAPEGLEEALERELKEVAFRHGRLFVAEGGPQKVRWAQNIWYDVEEILFQSIGEAARKLRALQALWAYYPEKWARRGALIEEKLPFFRPKPLVFPALAPKVPLGSWTLIDERTILCSPRCSSYFAHGEVHFVETKAPPSRAYLKLWECFTRIGKKPGKGERCLEIGASPGGWTWALDQLGAQVVAVDRAALAPSVRCSQFLKRDAFSLKPEEFPDVQWIFSDVVCYPEKLLVWIRPWLSRNVQCICTLKFQGIKEDMAIIEEFEKLGKIIRLYHNKHELTWVKML